MADNFRFAQLQPFSLAGAGAVTGDTSITLKSMTTIDGASLSMATDFGSTGYGTLEPGNGTLEEQISFTTLTNNSNGTVTLGGVKSVAFTYPYTETSGLAKTHAGSTSFVISNTSGFYNKLTSKSDDETITGTWTFTNPNYPRMDTATPAPTDDEQLATKKYVDDTAVAGAPVSTPSTLGIVKISTTAADPANPIAVGDNDIRVSPVSLTTLTAGQVAALGGTSGTPSVSNKYVTNDDTSATGSGSKVVRGTSGKIDRSWLSNAFGGTGADGALSSSAGTTTIDLGNASVVEKNYTSISLTGTSTIAFTNPASGGTIVIFKSQGNVTMTSSTNPVIDLRGVGGAGGTGGASPIGSGNGGGAGGGAGASTSGSDGVGVDGGGSTSGGGFGSWQFSEYETGGTAGGVSNAPGGVSPRMQGLSAPYVKYFVMPGSGGGGGAGGNVSGTGGNGGAGGGALYIECGGALNITSTINAAGGAGGTGTGNCGGGGGGGGGSVVILYNSLTASAGTYTVTGGAAGTTGGGNAGAGGDGFSKIALNTEFL